jgi:hypothetical protein
MLGIIYHRLWQGNRKIVPAPHYQVCIKLCFGPRAVSARSGHEGKKAPEGPTPKSIVTRCEPGRLAVRELEAALPHYHGKPLREPSRVL